MVVMKVAGARYANVIREESKTIEAEGDDVCGGRRSNQSNVQFVCISGGNKNAAAAAADDDVEELETVLTSVRDRVFTGVC